jgi:squalene synthase HpnC
MQPPAAARAAPIEHYENFPVASWLCPPHLRAPIAAIYHFARTADDLADEGQASAEQRLADLAAYRQALNEACAISLSAPAPSSTSWPKVFGPLARAIADFALPPHLLHALLDAFEHDVRTTRDGGAYPDMSALLAYCANSANPVGRLLLHLYGVQDAPALARSDAICTALQLINFWQDPSRDLPRGRNYFPRDGFANTGFDPVPFMRQPSATATPSADAMVRLYAADARARMEQGQALVHRLPGRAGWELRLVVQGGLRIIDKIEGTDPWRQRPSLVWHDWVLMLWRAWWMRAQ